MATVSLCLLVGSGSYGRHSLDVTGSNWRGLAPAQLDNQEVGTVDQLDPAGVLHAGRAHVDDYYARLSALD